MKTKVAPTKISPYYIKVGQLVLMADSDKLSLLENGHTTFCLKDGKCDCEVSLAIIDKSKRFSIAYFKKEIQREK